MGDAPWNRNEGKFDRPSSSAPTGRFVGTGERRRFEPSPEALRDYGAAVVSEPREGVFVTGFRIGIAPDPDPTPPRRHYSDKAGRRIRKDRGNA